MLLAWVAYALTVALLLTGAAAAAESERGLRLTGREARGVWPGAMTLSVGLPAVCLAAPHVGGLPAPGGVPPEWTSIILAGPVSASAPEAGGRAGTMPVDVWFPWLWAGLSAAVLAWLVISARRLHRICRCCPTRWSDGAPVVRTSGLGPGVVGVRRPRIVVPDWVLQMDEHGREVVLLHEREHVRCRDPSLLHLGWGLVALVPWLVPLWWQLRRLRMAVELDCDQRVVDRVGDARGDGHLLVEAKRLSLGLSAPLVVGGASFLARRVRRLAADGVRRRGSCARLAGSAVACALALSAVALLPPPGAASPGDLEPAETSDETAETAASGEEDLLSWLPTAYDEPPEVLNRQEVQASLRAEHPEVLRRRGVGGEVLTILDLEADGRVTGGFVSVSSDRAALDRVAREVAADIRYSPARRDGEPVAVWLGQPLQFPVE